jgi:hypothetical protein
MASRYLGALGLLCAEWMAVHEVLKRRYQRNELSDFSFSFNEFSLKEIKFTLTQVPT